MCLYVTSLFYKLNIFRFWTAQNKQTKDVTFLLLSGIWHFFAYKLLAEAKEAKEQCELSSFAKTETSHS